MTSSHLVHHNFQYYSKALAQMILLKHRLREQQELECELKELREKVQSKQSKHRRCDRQIAKSFNCSYCQRIYASDVALKLHLKLKHGSQESRKTAIEKNSFSAADDTEHISSSLQDAQKVIMQSN